MKLNKQEFLEQIVAFQEFVEERAMELVLAEGIDFTPYVHHVEFENETVDVFFEESTRHDCPDTTWRHMTLELLNMDEPQWKKYIEGVKKIADQKQNEKLQAEEQRKLLAKHEQFTKLKEELGL